MTDKFQDILGKKVEDAERPKPIPEGTVQLAVKAWETVESARKKTPGVMFTYAIVAYQDDVDAEQLEEYGDVTGKEFRDNLWLTDNTLWRLRELLEVMGLETEGREFKEVLAECLGAEVFAVIKHEMSEDGEQRFARITKYLPVE